MPPMKSKRPKSSISVGSERTPMCQKLTGLAQKLSSLFANEAFVPGKSTIFPDLEMTDSEPIRAENNGLKVNTPFELAPNVSSSSKGKEVVRERTTDNAELSATKIAVPAFESTALKTAMQFPPELQSVMEAEKRRTTQIQAQLAICSTAISSVETALSPLSIGENKEFVDGIKVYLRAAISQFVQSGPGTTPQVLPARPANPLPPRTPEIRVPNPTKTRAPAPKSTWATVARAGLVSSAGPSTKKAAPSAPKVKSANSRTTVDTRLFLRLTCNHPHRLLSSAGIRSAVSQWLDTPASDITLVKRVKTGFALTAKDEIAKKALLESSVLRRDSRIILEPESNMHAEAECKALTRCRNCGGPHRSDSRVCLARPTKNGPVNKDRLAWTRHIEQVSFAKMARVRATAKMAEEEIIAAAKDVSVSEATGFGLLESEEEA
ncbi:EKA-like protein [Blumeria hordei DH14]|uniref:EKA-like protein n=1 Tax=Blumeria graminis f. sp. hordei (strain DH14) TaxID=546991 RepID=N1J7L5_BLUG1|nr:EKA-like protein [Blumeria hordei DH14]